MAAPVPLEVERRVVRASRVTGVVAFGGIVTMIVGAAADLYGVFAVGAFVLGLLAIAVALALVLAGAALGIRLRATALAAVALLTVAATAVALGVAGYPHLRGDEDYHLAFFEVGAFVVLVLAVAAALGLLTGLTGFVARRTRS